MPITLNGSGTVTGISAGGLPDGSITPADLSTGAPTWDSSGRLLVGTSTARANFRIGATNYTGTVQHETETQPFFTVVGGSSGAGGPYLMLGHQRSGAVGGNTVVASSDELGVISFHGSDGTNLISGARIEAVVDGTPGSNDMPGRLVFSTTADGASSPTEHMRLRSSGELIWGNGSVTTSANPGVMFINKTYPYIEISSGGDTASRYKMTFLNGNGMVGRIETSGTSTSYVTTSDYRVKENVVPLTNAIQRFNQLQVHRFNFIADPDTTFDGFIAHEAQAVVPECVTGEKDAVDDDGNPIYQGIDQSKLVPLLTAALQEAIAKIETLEAKVAALESN